MQIDILTIFPGMYSNIFNESLIKKATDRGLVDIKVHDLRDWTTDKHHQIDDTPYGGGPGMVFKPEPLYAALSELKKDTSTIILTCPKGKHITQKIAADLSNKNHLIIIAAHYEGIDERVTQQFVDISLSIGDVVLFGGELPSMVICEAVVRLLPEVVGNIHSIEQDSFQQSLLDHPHYTRPANYLGQNVPDVLLSGNHSNIERWRMQQSIVNTFNKRPDLFARAVISDEQKNLFTDYLKK